jgi:hypothetical protein
VNVFGRERLLQRGSGKNTPTSCNTPLATRLIAERANKLNNRASFAKLVGACAFSFHEHRINVNYYKPTLNGQENSKYFEVTRGAQQNVIHFVSYFITREQTAFFKDYPTMLWGKSRKHNNRPETLAGKSRGSMTYVMQTTIYTYSHLPTKAAHANISVTVNSGIDRLYTLKPATNSIKCQ